MDNDKLYNFLDKIYTELQSQSKSLDSIEIEFKKTNKKIDDAISIKKEMLTMSNKSKKSF